MISVGHAYWTGTQPLPVEITNHTDWWTQWLPAGVAWLVAFIALGGVIWTTIASDKRSKQDREDAHQREFRAWQRETILRLATDAMEAFVTANVLLLRLAYLDTPITRKEFEPITQASLRITEVALTLQLLGVDEAADLCVALSGAISNADVLDATLAVNTAQHVANPIIGSDEAMARFDELTKPLASAHDAFAVAVKKELQGLGPAKSGSR